VVLFSALSADLVLKLISSFAGIKIRYHFYNLLRMLRSFDNQHRTVDLQDFNIDEFRSRLAYFDKLVDSFPSILRKDIQLVSSYNDTFTFHHSFKYTEESHTYLLHQLSILRKFSTLQEIVDYFNRHCGMAVPLSGSEDNLTGIVFDPNKSTVDLFKYSYIKNAHFDGIITTCESPNAFYAYFAFCYKLVCSVSFSGCFQESTFTPNTIAFDFKRDSNEFHFNKF